MTKAIVIVAATLFLGAGIFAGSAQAQTNTCKTHKDQATCSADKACKWVAAENECNKAQAKKK